MQVYIPVLKRTNILELSKMKTLNLLFTSSVRFVTQYVALIGTTKRSLTVLVSFTLADVPVHRYELYMHWLPISVLAATLGYRARRKVYHSLHIWMWLQHAGEKTQYHSHLILMDACSFWPKETTSKTLGPYILIFMCDVIRGSWRMVRLENGDLTNVPSPQELRPKTCRCLLQVYQRQW